MRPDGFHDLRTIFQSIALHDTLTIVRTRGPLQLTCDEPTCPSDSTNLIWRAAEAVWKASARRGAPRGVAIHLEKRIPLQAGLGGGSSDAAAALRALGRLWGVDRRRLRTLGADLGADVPYFFEGGTMLGLDRGDRLERLRDGPRRWVVLVIPSFGVSTKDAYAWWDRASRRRSRQRAVDDGPAARFDRGNDLQDVVSREHPVIPQMVRELAHLGARDAAMSGSGSAVFGLFSSEAAAIDAAAAVVGPARRALVTRTLDRAAYQRLAGR